MRLWVGTVAAVLWLAGCGPEPAALHALNRGPRAPAGTPVVREAVDGLVVGHRLMAAGEYELALKAYARAGAEQGLTADVLSALGSANLRLGRLNQSKRLLERAVERDPRSVPAWNNLGVVLMEMGKPGEARGVFRNAFALDNGNSDIIRENLRRAIAKSEKPAYRDGQEKEFGLVRRGRDRYLLLRTPAPDVEQ